jgi:LysM repeat protein
MNSRFNNPLLTSFLAFSLVILAIFGVTTASNAQANCGSTYMVQAGDTLTSIAAKCGDTLAALEEANPSLTDPSLITSGEVVNIPQPSSTQSTYTVKSGDTLSQIAVNLGASLSALEAANPQISDPSLILPGQVINIPAGIPVTGGTAQVTITPLNGISGSLVAITGAGFPASSALNLTLSTGSNPSSAPVPVNTDASGSFSTSITIPSSAAQGSVWTIMAAAQGGSPSASAQFQVIAPSPSGSYTVQSGDTLSGLALRFNTSVNALVRANPSLIASSQLTVGQQLNIPGSVVTINGTTDYIVKSGDSLSKIAASQNLTLAAIEGANSQISNFSLILPGQQITLPASIPVTGSSAQLALNPLSGPAGTEVTVTGSGFTANTTLDVTVASGSSSPSPTSSAITDTSGGFNLTVAIPSNAAAGSQWAITVTPQTGSGSSASADFQVIASPPSGAYTIQSGDTLSGLALHFNTTVNALLRGNPQITNPDLLTAGSVLYIPGSTVTINGQTVYIVTSGNYLVAIAARHDVTLAALEKANPTITTPSLIYPGQRVIIP